MVSRERERERGMLEKGQCRGVMPPPHWPPVFFKGLCRRFRSKCVCVDNGWGGGNMRNFRGRAVCLRGNGLGNFIDIMGIRGREPENSGNLISER